MSDAIARAQAWFVAHPTVTAWLVTLVVTAVVKLPSEPAWARFKTRHSRAAAALQLLRAVGIDANKLRYWLPILLTGRLPPPSAGTGDGADALPARPDNGGSAQRVRIGATVALAALLAAGCSGTLRQQVTRVSNVS